MTKTGVVLLSGGLDSFVSIEASKEICDIKLALTFDYGQRALDDEILASGEIARFYKIEHRIIKQPCPGI